MSAKEHYLKGHYESAAASKSSSKDIVYKISGLIFTGQHLAARILFKEYLKELSLEDQIMAQFHLGISYVRTSEYKLAQEQFIKNLRLIRSNKVNPVSYFFCFQGLSFYRFFFSEHKKSYFWANKAYSYLLKSKKTFSLFFALSYDLQGHNLIQLGKIHLGISQLKKALSICKQNNYLTLKNDIEVSIAIYQSEYNENPKSQITLLTDLLNTNESKSDYSKSALVIQIAKLYLIMGKYSLAKNFLTLNYDLIYNNENKRKIAGLNTLMADLLYKNGQHLEALSVAKIARKNLDEKIDISLILPIIILEIKILNILKKDVTDLMDYTEKLISNADRYLDKKIFSRLKNTFVQTEIGQDPLGDIIDLVHKKKEVAFDLILKNELFGLLPRYFNLIPGQKYLLIINELNYAFSIDFDSIDFLGSLTKNQYHFLYNISFSSISKEKLIENIWGYQYDSIRHDSLIYTTISRLKKILNNKKHWIVADETKYSAQNEIQIIFKSYKDLKQKNINSSSASEMPIKQKNLETKTFGNSNKLAQKNITNNLNYRLIQTISDPPETPISVSNYAETWKVTRMTSLRDLSELCKLGLAIKIGQGKATRYLVQSV